MASKSPDLYLVDYAVWGPSTDGLSTSTFTTISQLKQAIVTEWGKLSQCLVNRATGQWRHMFECVVQQQAGHIEHLM